MTSLSAIGFFRRDTTQLSELPENSYENIFRIYSTKYFSSKEYFFYNILNSVYIPADIPTAFYYNITVTRVMPWTAISYNEYRTMNLWWLICAVNQITNPVIYPVPSTVLKIIKSEYVRVVLDDIRRQLS